MSHGSRFLCCSNHKNVIVSNQQRVTLTPVEANVASSR